jgi:hypothetical protein
MRPQRFHGAEVSNSLWSGSEEMRCGLVLEFSVVRSYRDVVVGGQAVNKSNETNSISTTKRRKEYMSPEDSTGNTIKS